MISQVWLALLTTCTHSSTCNRIPTLNKGQRHIVTYRIPSPKAKTGANTDLAQTKQSKSCYTLLKVNP